MRCVCPRKKQGELFWVAVPEVTRKDNDAFTTGNTVRPLYLVSVGCKLTPVNTSLSAMTGTIQYLAPSINLSPNLIPLEC